jgi:hypothetical protein
MKPLEMAEKEETLRSVAERIIKLSLQENRF